MKYYVTLIMHDWKGYITGNSEDYSFDCESDAVSKAKEISDPHYIQLRHDMGEGDSADITVETESDEIVYSKTVRF